MFEEENGSSKPTAIFRWGMLLVLLAYLLAFGMAAGPPFVPLKGNLFPWIEFILWLGAGISIASADHRPLLPILIWGVFECIWFVQEISEGGVRKGLAGAFLGSVYPATFAALAFANWFAIRKSASADETNDTIR